MILMQYSIDNAWETAFRLIGPHVAAKNRELKDGKS